MADNTTLNPGTAGDVIATDDIAGVKYQRVKIAVGADGVAVDLSSAAPMPIGTLPAGTNNIGDVDVLTLPPLPAGTNNIGDVDVLTLPALPAGTNNIGDVDVLTMPASAGSAAQDAAIAGNPVPDGWRASTAVPTPMSADGDVVYPWATRSGAMNSVLRDLAGDSCMDETNNALRVNLVVGAAAGGTSIVDGSAFARTTGVLTPAGAAVETSPPTLTTGQVAALSQTTTGSLRVAVTSGGIAGQLEDGISAGGEEGMMILGVRRDTPSSGVSADGDFGAFSLTSDGSLRVASNTAVPAGTNNIGDVDIVTMPAVAGPVAADAAVSGNPVLVGMRASTATPTAMSADGDAVMPWATRNGAQVIDGSILDDAAFVPGTSRVVSVGFLSDETATDSVDEGDIGAGRMTLDRKIITTQYVHAAAGGTSAYSAISTAAVLSAAIKASPGKVYSLQCFNVNAAARFVRLYNMTTAPGSADGANILWRGIIPGGTTGAGFSIPLNGIQFSTGIGIRASSGIADTDTGVLAANELTFNVEYA